MLLILGLSLPAFAQTKSQVDLTGRNVLVLHALEANMPLNVRTDRAIMAALEAGGIGMRNQFFEYLDLQRNAGLEHRKRLAEMMHLRYGKRKIDVIITLYPEALEFLLKDCREIFPDAPIVALYMAPSFQLPKTDRRIIQHVFRGDMRGTLEIALKLVSKAKRVYVVGGVHSLDKKNEAQARQDFKKWEGQLTFRYLSDMSLEEMLATVSSAPPETIIFYMAMTGDITGKTYNPRDVAKRLRQVSNGPVFGLYETLLEHGIVGGSIVAYGGIGTQAGRLALSILGIDSDSDKTSEILDVPGVAMFDWRELRHWKLSEAALPKGSIVINRESRIWDYKYYIIGGLALFLVQLFLIAGLLLQRRRKKVAEEELNQFFNVTLDLLCIANIDGYFLRLNPAWKKILGYTREELMANRFLEFVHPDDLDRTREVVSTLSSQQEVISFENRYRCKDGTYRWLEWSSAPAGDLIYAAARDITERKQMQDRIRNAAEEWRTTFDSIQDLVMILDPEFKLVRVNATSLSFFNLPLEKVLGKHCYELMHGTSEPVGTCPLAKMIKTKRHEETELYDDKTDVWLHVSVDPVFDVKGEIIRVIHTVKDVTEHKRAESEASRARRELLRMDRLSRMGELTASLAHELNQPLAAILSNAQAGLRFLQSEKPDLNELREILQDITNDDKRAGGVIRSLRAMMRQEEKERESLSINELLSDVVSLFHSEAVLRNVIIAMDFPESLPPLLADKIQLQQVVLNLMMNAVEAMDHEAPEKRKIVLKTRRADHAAIQVAVRDSGSGVEGENLDRIFQPFFTTKGAGLGMGLSFCRSIIEAHGGRLWAENNQDKGATFFFELPMSETSGK
jgi:PAS domain S-box-containing protein